MGVDLSGESIAVIGGDQRQIAVVQALCRCGARVGSWGLPESAIAAGARPAGSLHEALAAADVVLLPITGTDERGVIKTIEGVPPVVFDAGSFSSMRPGALLLTGSLRQVWKPLVQNRGIRVVEYAEEDEIAILNSIPTAEGAIQLAMQELPITVHGSRSYILGFGRCAVTLARMLQAIGARTTVYARRPAQLARAFEMGFAARHLERLADDMGDAQVIYNTIPAMVLPESLLLRANPDVLVIDIASSPGGTDFQAAGRLGIRAVLALGLPGKVAPKTAGEILASALPGLISRALASR